MDKLKFMRLWDLYGGLLTPTQREITDMYFNMDLTVSEIAEQKGISRQGVSDCLNICKRELGAYDEKLRHGILLEESEKRALSISGEVGVWADCFLELHPEYAADIERLKAIINKDYGDESGAEDNGFRLTKDRSGD